MSFSRCVLLVSIISLSVAGALVFFGSFFGYEEFRGGYVVLTTDASVEDRTLRSLLESGNNNFWGEPVSESSQWVLLDEFDSIQKIPLDKFSARIFPFDPRNDGFAAKLRNIFIRDDKRFVYIPLKAGNVNTGLLNRQFEELLADIPFSVDFFGIGHPLRLFFIAYAAASLGLLVICFLKRKKNRKTSSIAALIPVFSSLAFFGAAGIACAALLFALFILLKEPLGEIFAYPDTKLNPKNNRQVYKEIFFTYRFYWLFLPLFAAAISVIVIFSQLKFLFLLAVFAAGTAVFLLSMKIFSLSKIKQGRFTPVLIMRRRFPEFVFSVYILPFAASILFVLFAAPYMAVSYNSNEQFDIIIDEQDYLAHLAFQTSFSTRRMGPSGGTSGAFTSAFPAFFFEADGLPSMEVNPGVNPSINVNDFPPFPLKNLMAFFYEVNSGQRTYTDGGAALLSDILPLMILLLFVLPCLFIRRKSDRSSKVSIDDIKRMKVRWKGINWNKKSLYNNRNLLQIQKDA